MFFFLAQIKNTWSNILNYYRFRIKGLFIFKVFPSYISDDEVDSNDMKNALENLQQKYCFLNFNSNYSGNSVKIKLSTNKKIFISDKHFLRKFTESLGETLNKLPTNKYFIDINFRGTYSNIKNHSTFLIFNKGNKIEIEIKTKSQTILKYIHFFRR